MIFNKKLVTAVSGAVLLMAGQIALADSTTDIVDALVSKGVLTEEEGKLISKGHETKKKAEGTVGFKDGFKFSSGDGKSSMSVNGRIQADYRYFDTPTVASAGVQGPNSAFNADTFDIRRAYLGVKGTFRGWMNFEATLDGAGSSAYVKYYWLEAAFSDAFKVRFGQFKPGFGLEQLTSSRFIDMTERDWVASMAPGVNKGIQIAGTPITGMTYALGFNNGSVGTLMADSSQKATEITNNSDGKQVTARVTFNAAEYMGNKEAIAHIGAAYAYDDNAPGAASTTGAGVSFRTNARGTQFLSTTAPAGTTATFYSNPDVTRYGLEGIGSYGPLKLQAEYASMDFQQSGYDDKSINAYYANLSYMLTGEAYAGAYKNGIMDRMSPKNNFTGLGSSGLGAWEIGLRYSKLDATDFVLGTDVVTAASSNDVHSWTGGIKWITDPNTRFMLDYVYTDFGRYITGSDDGKSAALTIPAFRNEKAINFRAQFDF